MRPIARTALFATGVAGVLFTGLKPALVSSYVSHGGIDEIVAGYLISIEVIAALTGTVVAGLRSHVWDRRQIAATGLALIVTGNALAIWADGAVQIGLARLVAGLGEGLAMGLFAAVLAGAPRPDRQFGLFTILILLIAAGAYRLVPVLLDCAGLAGLFVMLSIPAIVALPLSAAIPRTPHGRPLDRGDIRSEGDPIADQRAHLKFASSVLLIGALSFYLAAGGVWPYVGQIGLRAGIPAVEIASVLGYSSVCGAIGGLVSLTVGLRFGRALPIAIAISLGAACLLMLLRAHAASWMFSAAVQLFMFGWLMFFPYLMGVASALDPLGRLSSLIYTVSNIGFFIGPILCAQAIRFGGYRAVVCFGVVSLVTALCTLAPLAARVDRVSGGHSASCE